jgi:hypothetical protein
MTPCLGAETCYQRKLTLVGDDVYSTIVYVEPSDTSGISCFVPTSQLVIETHWSSRAYNDIPDCKASFVSICDRLGVCLICMRDLFLGERF